MLKRLRDDDDDCDVPTEPISNNSSNNVIISCTFPPCHNNSPRFRDYFLYEAHIIQCHSFACSQCHKKFPSDSLLDIHIDENHNPFFQLEKERGGKVYKCLQYSNIKGGCTKKCIDKKKRRLHMIDKHGYPKDFNFGIIQSGISEKSVFLTNNNK